MSDDLDRWLGRELPGLLTGAEPPAAARYLAMRRHRPRWRLRLASLPAVVGTKLLVGVGAVAVAAAGVGVKTAVTGSPNPLVWSHGAQPAVQQCMATGPSHAGRGQCVSTAVTASPPGRATASGAPGSAHSRAGSGNSPGSSGDHPSPHPHPTPPPHPTPAGDPSSGAPRSGGWTP
jgi:hypothetical protein